MDYRDYLISAAYAAKGEYFRILKIIADKEEVKMVHDEHCITIVDDDYPRELRELKYPPFVLFYRGDKSLLQKKKVAIIGSRIPSDYACRVVRMLAGKCEEVVVSGMAKGIDASAHFYAHRTIAVLGSGIDVIYPRENFSLYYSLIATQLVISEYPPGVAPLAAHFPFRNRIIAALGGILYLLESKARSGSMTTVNCALELGRRVKVLPYSLFDDSGINNNRLINEGAEMIDRDDIGLTSEN